MNAPLASSAAWLGVRVFLPFAAGYFLSYLYRVINAVLSPYLAAELGLAPSALGLLTSIYFLTFAAAQLPLGLLLDRLGPRRVEAALLLFAAVGAALFALSNGLTGLMIGRGLIGLGVSACLMASFKAFVLWFPAARLPAINGWILAVGGLGALTATAPVEILLPWIGWRGLFIGLAVASMATAAAVWLVVPESVVASSADDGRAGWRGVAMVFGSAQFWRIAPASVLVQATFLAIQGLWAGPWLRDVAGLDQATAARILLAMATGMTAGFVGLGQLAYHAAQRGIPPLTVAMGGMLLFIGVQAMLLFDLGPLPLLWTLFGFLGVAGTLIYAVLTQIFPPELAGRVNTALNLLVFVAAFAAQWGMGALIGLWPNAAGGHAATGYHWAFGLALAAQLLGWLWLATGPDRQSQATD